MVLLDYHNSSYQVNTDGRKIVYLDLLLSVYYPYNMFIGVTYYLLKWCLALNKLSLQAKRELAETSARNRSRDLPPLLHRPGYGLAPPLPLIGIIGMIHVYGVILLVAKARF